MKATRVMIFLSFFFFFLFVLADLAADGDVVLLGPHGAGPHPVLLLADGVQLDALARVEGHLPMRT